MMYMAALPIATAGVMLAGVTLLSAASSGTSILISKAFGVMVCTWERTKVHVSVQV